MRHAGRMRNAVCTVSFFGPTANAARRPIGGFSRSGMGRSVTRGTVVVDGGWLTVDGGRWTRPFTGAARLLLRCKLFVDRWPLTVCRVALSDWRVPPRQRSTVNSQRNEPSKAERSVSNAGPCPPSTVHRPPSTVHRLLSTTTRSPVPSHAAPALRFGARLDLPDALARQAEDLADVAEGELVVLKDSVSQLQNRLLFECQPLDGALHRPLLLQVLQVRNTILRDELCHPCRNVADLVPEVERRFRVRICIEKQDRELALTDRQLFAKLLHRSVQNRRHVFVRAVQKVGDFGDGLRDVVAHAVTQREDETLLG